MKIFLYAYWSFNRSCNPKILFQESRVMKYFYDSSLPIEFEMIAKVFRRCGHQSSSSNELTVSYTTFHLLR